MPLVAPIIPPVANLHFFGGRWRESAPRVAFKRQMTNAVNRARNAQEWGAALPQWLGMVGLVFCALFWAVTAIIDPPGQVEPLFISAFGGLIFVGQAGEAVVTLKRVPPTVAPESSPTPENGQA